MRPRSSSLAAGLATLVVAAAAAALPPGECRSPAVAPGDAPALSPAAAALADGNGKLREGQPVAALAAYRESEALARAAGHRDVARDAAANAARAAIAAGELEGVETSLEGLLAALAPDADARSVTRLAIHVARSYAELALAAGGPRSDAARRRAGALLAEAAAGAADPRARSYALGYRGALYLDAGLLEEGRVLTRQALVEANRAVAPDALYRWFWQLGRIERRAGDEAAAVDAYRRAVATLAVIRADIALASADAAFAFRGEVEPLYLELVDLLLRRAEGADPGARQQLLAEARDTLEGWKAAEVSEHFRDACLAAQQQVAPEQVPGAAVLYPVVLPDRVALIVATDAGLELHRAPIDGATLRREARELRRLLQKRTTREFRPVAARLYEALVRPVAPLLAAGGVEVLVVVPGGALRTIPFAALYDAGMRQYLVEQVAVAVTPGLTLTDPRPIDLARAQGLIAAITESVQGFPALEHTAAEVADIRQDFPAAVLVDEDFEVDRFEQEVAARAVSIVHVASHGEFRPDSSESFLLAYDQKLSMDRFAATVGRTRLRTEVPLELIVLSACQTAEGDERAALGLAGVALQSGARSALATLWSVNDEASARLIGRFYEELAGGASRAAALRTAQIALLRDHPFRHPIYWSPFLLISSWL